MSWRDLIVSSVPKVTPRVGHFEDIEDAPRHVSPESGSLTGSFEDLRILALNTKIKSSLSFYSDLQNYKQRDPSSESSKPPEGGLPINAPSGTLVTWERRGVPQLGTLDWLYGAADGSLWAFVTCRDGNWASLPAERVARVEGS